MADRPLTEEEKRRAADLGREPLTFDYLLAPDEPETKTIILAAAGMIEKCIKETGKPPVAIELTNCQAEALIHQRHGLWVDVDEVFKQLEKDAVATGLPGNQVGSIDGVPIFRQVSELPETAPDSELVHDHLDKQLYRDAQGEGDPDTTPDFEVACDANHCTEEGVFVCILPEGHDGPHQGHLRTDPKHEKLWPQAKGEPEKCGYLGPFRGSYYCELPAGHDGLHRRTGDFPNGKIEWPTRSEGPLAGRPLPPGVQTAAEAMSVTDYNILCPHCGSWLNARVELREAP